MAAGIMQAADVGLDPEQFMVEDKMSIIQTQVLKVWSCLVSL